MAEKKSVVVTAKARFERAKSAYGKLREQAVEDTKFVLGDSENNWQWPEDVYQARSGISRKPCLTINITAQHCKQVINQIRQNRPSSKVIPADGGADVKTAEILGGMLRSIQSYSNADTAHDIAATHSVYGGEGFWRVLTEYESDTSFDQVITIKALSNPQLVYIDPDAIEPDRSDAKWCLIFEDIPREQAEEEYADSDDIRPIDWVNDGDKGWCGKDTIRRAEYFWCEDKETTLYQLDSGRAVTKYDLPEDVKIGEGSITGPDGQTAMIVAKRETTVKRWKWARIVGGSDKPEDQKDWPGAYMPIMCVVGDETNVNGEIVRKGLVRDIKDSARLVNYSYSAAVETVALQTKTPWLASGETIEGYEGIWNAANLENRAYLPWNAFGENGEALPKPERVAPAAMATAQVQMLQLSVEQARASTGQQNANFGIKSEAQSGVGIQRLKAQGEIATFNFPDNLGRSLKYEAKVILDLIPKIYDRERIVRILGLDGAEKMVKLDPAHQGGAQQVEQDETGVEAIFNPTVGRYDVVIDTGPSYQSQRQEAAANLSEMASRAPILMQAAPDLVFKAMDFPMASEIADRLAKTVPAQLRDGGDEKEKLQMQLQQAQQAMEELQGRGQQDQQVIGKMQQHIDKLEIMLRGDVIKNQGAIELERVRNQYKAAQGVADHGVKAYDAQTDRVKAIVAGLSPIELQALAAQTVQETLAAQPLQPEMDEPTIPIPINPMDGNLQPATAGFSLPEESPPEMAATGAQPGPEQSDLPEGNPNV